MAQQPYIVEAAPTLDNNVSLGHQLVHAAVPVWQRLKRKVPSAGASAPEWCRRARGWWATSRVSARISGLRIWPLVPDPFEGLLVVSAVEANARPAQARCFPFVPEGAHLREGAEERGYAPSWRESFGVVKPALASTCARQLCRSSAVLRTHDRDRAMRVVEHGVAYRTQQ